MLLTSRKNALNKSRKRVKKGRNVLSFHDEVDIIENCMPRQHCIALNESSKKIVFLQKKPKTKTKPSRARFKKLFTLYFSKTTI